MNHVQIEKALRKALKAELPKGAADEICGRLLTVFIRLRRRATDPAWDSVMDSVNAALNLWLTTNTPVIREATADRARRYLTSVDNAEQIQYWIDDIRDHVLPVVKEFYDYRRR